jgi:hypothetical protein
MDMCICGHSEREHDPTGECRAAGCRCRHFKPEIRLPRHRAASNDGLTSAGAPRPHGGENAPAVVHWAMASS